MSFFQDFFDFLYRNIHWVLLALVLILLWRTLSQNTFIVIAIIAIILFIMWDNYKKGQDTKEAAKEAFLVGRGMLPNGGRVMGGRGPELLPCDRRACY